MRRKKILVAALVASLMGGWMQVNAKNMLIVEPVDGARTETALADIASITFGDNALTIVSTSGAVELAYSEIQRITFGMGPSGVEKLTKDESALKVNYADSKLFISGAEGAVDVAIFSISGKTIFAEAECTSDVIDLSKLSSGVYIAKINNVVVKFVK